MVDTGDILVFTLEHHVPLDMIAAPSSHFEFKKNCNVLIVFVHISPVICNLDGSNPPIEDEDDADEMTFGLGTGVLLFDSTGTEVLLFDTTGAGTEVLLLDTTGTGGLTNGSVGMGSVGGEISGSDGVSIVSFLTGKGGGFDFSFGASSSSFEDVDFFT